MNGDSPPRVGRRGPLTCSPTCTPDGGDRSGLDADALDVLAALDATRADLASLPPMRMPDHSPPVSTPPWPPRPPPARVHALHGTAGRRAAPVSAATGRRRLPPPHPARPWPISPTPAAGATVGWASRAALVAAAAVAIGVVVVSVPGSSTGGTPQAIPGRPPASSPTSTTARWR